MFDQTALSVRSVTMICVEEVNICVGAAMWIKAAALSEVMISASSEL